jgi:hypothetical protein
VTRCSAPIRPTLHTTRRRYKNQDDARDTFKTLRSQHIGDRSAFLYYEWAALEQLAGNTSKALSVLQKGLREQAQPAGCEVVPWGSRFEPNQPAGTQRP